MDVVIWTAIFLGGDLLIVIVLLYWAFKKDREKAVIGGGDQPGEG